MHFHFLLPICSALVQVAAYEPEFDSVPATDYGHDPCEFIALDHCPSLWADDFLSLDVTDPIIDMTTTTEFVLPACDFGTIEGCDPVISDFPFNFGVEDFLTAETVSPDLGPNDCRAFDNPFQCPFSPSYPEFTFECTPDRASCLVCTRHSNRPCYRLLVQCVGDGVDLDRDPASVKTCYFCHEDGRHCRRVGDIEKLPSPTNPYGQEWNTCPNKICL